MGAAEGLRVAMKTGAGVLDDSVTRSDVTIMEVGDEETIAGEGVASYMELVHGVRSINGRRDKSGVVRRVVSAFYSDSSHGYDALIANRNMFVIFTFLRQFRSSIPPYAT